MDSIQTDVSDAALVTAIRANMCDFFRHMVHSNPTENFEGEKFIRWYTPVSHPWFSGVLCTQPPAPEDESFIDETIQYFRARKIHTFTWWREPQLQRAEWEAALAKHGFQFSADTPGMAVDLQKLNESAQPVAGLKIRRVQDEESMRTWTRIFVIGYGLPAAWESVVFNTWMKLGLELPIGNYLGYLNGEPVSTATLFYGGGAAGIYDVSTLPEARGKGLGTALTLHPLLEAREKGYRVGVLQSSEMGFNVYQKLGFRHLCQVENFYLTLAP